MDIQMCLIEYFMSLAEASVRHHVLLTLVRIYMQVSMKGINDLLLIAVFSVCC